MSNLKRSYTVTEVKQIMNASEGRGPGVGGHAIKDHGFLRTDVSSRGKRKDSAFQPGWTLKVEQTSPFEDSIMRGVFDDYEPPKPIIVHKDYSSDQYIAVCNALNSDKGQLKLGQLDQLSDVGWQPSQPLVFEEPVPKVGLIPLSARAIDTGVESVVPVKKMHVEIMKIDGELHIHTAYSV